jgi:DNA-binding response OmpR family regulator
MAATLLAIEGDVSLCKMIRLLLTHKGFRVETACNAFSGLQKAYAIKPDLVLLDIMLPGMDGWQTCRRLREMSDVPIMMLSTLGTVQHVIKGLTLGADDYVLKPFSIEELVARIRALLRRAPRSNNGGNSGWRQVITYKHLAIDFDQRQVTVDSKPVTLSPTEFRLLSVLSWHRDWLLPHRFLLREVWGPECGEDKDTLSLHIGYLRHKIEKDPSNPSLIHSDWGIGYRFG